MQSDEHAALWYEDELYFFLLLDEFRPSEDRLGDLPGRLARGAITIKDAVGEIVKSQFFNARNPGNDTYVTVVLEQILGITVQKEPRILEAGKVMYDGKLTSLFGKPGRSQGDFVDIVLEQPAFSSVAVTRHLTRLLGAEPPKRDLDRAAARLRSDPGSFRSVEREFILACPADGSRRLRKKTDLQFVRSLYHDLFARAPTYQELRNVRNATQAMADPTGVRSIIIRTILESGAGGVPLKTDVEAGPWIAEQFRRLFSRRPSQAELQTFLEVWQSDACTPATILHALLTSAEYQHY